MYFFTLFTIKTASVLSIAMSMLKLNETLHRHCLSKTKDARTLVVNRSIRAFTSREDSDAR